MIDLMSLPLRQLQIESSLALATSMPTNGEIAQFTKKAHHDSQGFYRAVIQAYIDEHGDLPSKIGPASVLKPVCP